MAQSPARSLAKAEAIAKARGAAMTPIRRRILSLILKAKKPVGAYDLLAALKTETGKAMPPTVYRTLDFLIAQGFVHRIESRNAFVACVEADSPHRSQFAICDQCGRTVESMDDDLARKLSRQAARLGFTVERQIVEMHGICSSCQNGQDGRAHDHHRHA
jgi:Fur family transcriptional regulator, zinc uptake regulator